MKNTGKKLHSLAAAALLGLPLLFCGPANAQPHDPGAPGHRPQMGQPHGQRPDMQPGHRPDMRPDHRPDMKGGEQFRHGPDGRGQRPDHDGRFDRNDRRPDRDGKFDRGNRGHKRDGKFDRGNRGHKRDGKFRGRDHNGPDFRKMDDRAPHNGPAGHRPTERRD